MIVYIKLCQLVRCAIQMADQEFNFDLDRMKEALEAHSYTMPPNLSFEQFKEWIRTHESNTRSL